MSYELIRARFCEWWGTQTPHSRTFFETVDPDAARAFNALTPDDQNDLINFALRETLTVLPRQEEPAHA
jgi:hypothetical protein